MRDGETMTNIGEPEKIHEIPDPVPADNPGDNPGIPDYVPEEWPEPEKVPANE